MIISRNIQNKTIRGGKSRSPELVNGQIIMCRFRREGGKKLNNMK